ncbi:unnamed protein product [Adineta steineri]|uniref:Uncharacterized protein n=1 Tax=Adineta steineri TaxID=433720 RepID=A0A819J2F5_9BILA|nr:unnamed protein product [Adineta steineri]CAF3925515.1 unnamed protein product [Adineta steineri]
MFSTFADVFGSDDNHTNNPFGTSTTSTVDPFGISTDKNLTTSTTDAFGISTDRNLSTSTMDPFGISTDMKLSASSQRFDDSPFIIEASNDENNKFRSGKDALSSTNWNAYQNNANEPVPSFDPFENIQDKTTNLSLNNNNITHSKSINLINPFSIPTIPNEISIVPVQATAIDLLYDLNVDPSTLPANNSDNSLTHSDQVQSSYDLLGLNKQQASPTPSVKVLKSDSLTDIQKLNPTKNSSPSTSLLTKSNIPTAASYHSLPTNAPPTSPSTLRIQATALTIMTGTTTSTAPYDDQFLDWLTQSDDLMCGVDPNLSGQSKKADINMLKSTEDLLGSIYKQQQQQQPPTTLTTVQEVAQESTVSSPISIPKPSIRRPSIEDVPSICIHEPTSDHNDSNIVPQGYFDNKKKATKQQNDNDSDDSDDSKMVFKISEKKHDTSFNDMNIPVPLLPPPPSPSTTKKYKEASDDASSSSSATDDENDPLAMFRSKPMKNKTNEKQNNNNNNLISDWDEQPATDTKINQEEVRQEKARAQSVDYYLHEPDLDDSAPLDAYHSDINEIQLQQTNGWLLQIRVPLRQKDLYKSTFQRFSETRNWQEVQVRISFDEKKLRFYLPQTPEQTFAEIELQTWYQCTKLSLQQHDQYSKIHTFKVFEASYKEIPQVRMDRLVTLPEKLLRKFTRPNKAQQVLLDHANCVQQEIVKFGQLNYTYLKQFSIILDDLFWTMPVTRSRLQKHLKEEVTIKILDEYYAHIDKYRHICKHKSRTRVFILAFLNGTEPVVEIGMNDWFRHGKEVNKRNEIIINKTLQEYWIKPEQVELATIIDSSEYENTHLLKLIPPDSQKIEIMRFRTRPKQNVELPLQVYCFMSLIERQVNIRIEVIVSNAFNISILSKASSMATNDKTANIRDDNSDEQCPCENIQIRFPIPDAWVYMFRVEKRFRYGAIHSVRRKAGKIKGLDRFMLHRGDPLAAMMAASVGVAKYEQAFRCIVWRIDQLPKRDQGAYKTHIFECKLTIPSYDPVPEKFEPIAEVEYAMSQAFISHCQIRSVAIPQAEEAPEKWIKPKSQFTYTLDIEYAFKEEEKKEFAPVEIDMKEQSMSQSETENNSHSDESD